MKNINDLYRHVSRPVKVLQFGEGNFLRAFADYAIDVANEKNGFNGNIAVILPRAGRTNRFARQDNLYTVCLRGRRNGSVYTENRVITSIETVLSAKEEYQDFMALAHMATLEFVISNTTEAGIAFDGTDALEDCPASTFPGKLTKFLYERYRFYDGAADKGLIMLPTELNDNNGQLLRQCILQYAAAWQLPAGFTAWLTAACVFADTLVDRIVTGYPEKEAPALFEELGYEDRLLVKAEPFALWVIGEPAVASQFPVNSEGFPVEYTDRLQAFKEQKVRILNGAHTAMVLGAYLSGLDYVGQCMSDSVIRRQLDQTVFGEIVPTVHLPKEKAEAFAQAVYERFANPFVKHALLAISLNSVSKWRTRILPAFKDSLAATGRLPKWLTYSLAALLAFYRTEEAGDHCLLGQRGSNTYEIHDDAMVLQAFRESAGQVTADYVRSLMGRIDFWGEDLTQIPGFAPAVIAHLDRMAAIGVKAHIGEVGRQA